MTRRGGSGGKRARSHLYADWVRIDPLGLFGGSPQRFAEYVGWKYERRDGQHWVRPKESPGQARRLITTRRIASASNARALGAYAPLRSLADYGHTSTIPRWLVDAQRSAHLGAGTIPGAVAAFELAMAAANPREIATVAAHAFQDLLLTLPSASLWMVRVDPLALQRVTAIKGLLAAERFPEIFHASPTAGQTFQSASGQLSGLLVALPYIQPALTATAPYVVGAACARAGGVVAVLFDEPIDGRVGVTPTSLLDMASDETFARDELFPWDAPRASHGAIDQWWCWYIEHLNNLISEVLDPRAFADSSAAYLPREHLAFLLTLERLFANVTNSLAYTGSNDYLTKLLSFSALDCLEEMPGHADRVALLRPTRVESSLDILRGTLPPAVIQLLGRVFSVPAALQRVADGFFAAWIRRPGEVFITQKSGTRAWVPDDVAIGRYLNLVRNGTHGYSGFVTRGPDEDLLLTHVGTLPREVGDIAFAHVLKLLAAPKLALGRMTK